MNIFLATLDLRSQNALLRKYVQFWQMIVLVSEHRNLISQFHNIKANLFRAANAREMTDTGGIKLNVVHYDIAAKIRKIL